MTSVNKFESPALEYASLAELNLHNLLVGHHQHSIFFCYAQGDNLRSRGVFSGDLIVADRAEIAKQGDLVIALADEGFVLRVIDTHNRLLHCDNEPPLIINENVVIEAVAMQTIRCHRQLRLR